MLTLTKRHVTRFLLSLGYEHAAQHIHQYLDDSGQTSGMRGAWVPKSEKFYGTSNINAPYGRIPCTIFIKFSGLVVSSFLD